MKPSKEQIAELDALQADCKFDDVNTNGGFNRDTMQHRTIRYKRCHIIDRATKKGYATVTAKEPSEPEDVSVSDEDLLDQAIAKAKESPKPNSVISVQEKDAMLARMQLQQKKIEEQEKELERLRGSTSEKPKSAAKALAV